MNPNTRKRKIADPPERTERLDPRTPGMVAAERRTVDRILAEIPLFASYAEDAQPK